MFPRFPLFSQNTGFVERKTDVHTPSFRNVRQKRSPVCGTIGQASKRRMHPVNYDYANSCICNCFPRDFSFTSSDSWKLCGSSCKQYSACLWVLDFPQNNENVRFISVHACPCGNRSCDNLMLWCESKGKIPEGTCLPFFQENQYIPTKNHPLEGLSNKTNLKHWNYIIDSLQWLTLHCHSM